MKNKNAKASPVYFWIIGIVIALFVFGIVSTDSIKDIFSSKPADTVDLYPSDLKTSITLNTGVALATSATNANVSYYVFTSDGAYLKEGTTSTGTASFEVPTAGNYKLLIYSDTGTADFLPIVKEFSTDGDDPTGRAVKTINVDLFAESAATIQSVRDPVDLDSNVTQGAGQTVNFDVLVSATTSNAVLNEPIIWMSANTTCMENINFPALTEVDCPDKESVFAGYTAWCYKYDKQIKSSDGIMTFQGQLKIDSSAACPVSTATGGNATIKILDTGIYREANYKTKGFSAFQYGAENPVDNSDVGAADSSLKWLYFN